jgi:hypothetical protein
MELPNHEVLFEFRLKFMLNWGGVILIKFTQQLLISTSPILNSVSVCWLVSKKIHDIQMCVSCSMSSYTRKQRNMFPSAAVSSIERRICFVNGLLPRQCNTVINYSELSKTIPFGICWKECRGSISCKIQVARLCATEGSNKNIKEIANVMSEYQAVQFMSILRSSVLMLARHS